MSQEGSAVFELTKNKADDLYDEYIKQGKQIDIFKNPKDFLVKILQLYTDYGKRVLEAPFKNECKAFP